MNVGQELSVKEVRALLAGKVFRRRGKLTLGDSIASAQRNFESEKSVDTLIPDDFSGLIHFNQIGRKGLTYSEKLSSDGDGKFVYVGETIGY